MSAANLDKLRAIGFNFDEIRQAIGWEPLNTEFSQNVLLQKTTQTNLGDKEEKEGGEKVKATMKPLLKERKVRVIHYISQLWVK